MFDNLRKNSYGNIQVRVYFEDLDIVEHYLTRFERARLIGARAIQISMGAKPLIELDASLDPIDIAYEEFEAGVLPLDVIRNKEE